jgi:hypothetical protein
MKNLKYDFRSVGIRCQIDFPTRVGSIIYKDMTIQNVKTIRLISKKRQLLQE